MKITLNELRNFIKNVLKENINYPEVDLSDYSKFRDVWTLRLLPELKKYLQSNLKVYNIYNDKERYDNNLNIVSFNLDGFDKYLGAIRLDIIIDSITTGARFLSNITTKNGNVVSAEAALYSYKDGRWFEVNGSEEPFFESKKDIDLILDIYKNVAEKFMSTKLDTASLRNKWRKAIPDESLFKNSGNLGSQEKAEIGSSDFRRGGEMNFGGKSGGYKGKFPQKGFDNYDEWIGDVESSKKFAIETLYDLVKDGGIPPKMFNEKVKNILSSSSNKQSKFSSSDFRRGGEMSFGKSGDYKGKFPQKGFDNYDEWIGDVESSKRLAIETLYDLVNDGGIPPKKFNEKVKNILSSPLNELRNIIKKLITELKWSDRIEIYNEPVTYEEKKKWEGNYYKYYDDWMPLLEYFEIYEGASKDARIFARQLYSAVGYGNMTRDAFNRAIENKSKEDRWGIEITKEDREEEQTREKEAREKFAKEKRF